MSHDDDTDDPGLRFAGAAVPAAAPLGRSGGARAGADRSSEVLRTLEREPGDRLTCRRVFGDYYRCNWWASGGAAAAAARIDAHMIRGLEAATFRVRKSRLVKATMAEGHLVIEDVTNRALG